MVSGRDRAPRAIHSFRSGCPRKARRIHDARHLVWGLLSPKVEERTVSTQEENTARLVKRRVLVADDDPHIRTLCVTALRREGYLVDSATDGREALTRIEASDYHAVLLDLGMPYVHGATLLSIIGQTKPEMLRRVLVMTGAPDGAVDPLIGVAGAILRKPVEIDLLTRAVDQAGNAFDETMRVVS